MSYTGLVSSEHSSGGKKRQGAITKTGNSHLRRALVEAAWRCRHRPRTNQRRQKLLPTLPAQIVQMAETAQTLVDDERRGNVPPLSSGRTRKRGGSSGDERKAVPVTTTRGRLPSTACWAASFRSFKALVRS
jgi:Transposase IS116/IS110/IS902 family